MTEPRARWPIFVAAFIVLGVSFLLRSVGHGIVVPTVAYPLLVLTLMVVLAYAAIRLIFSPDKPAAIPDVANAARALQGTVIAYRDLVPPFVRFDRGDLRCLFAYRTDDVARSSMEAMLTSTVFLRALSRSSRRVGPREIEHLVIDDPDFLIETHSPAAAKLALSSGFLEFMRGFEQWAEAPVRAETGSGGIVLDVERILTADQLPSLVKFLDRMADFSRLLSGSNGVHVVETVERPNGSRCPVCLSKVESESVRCSSCRTPHHADCWRYHSRCGTYGCPGRSAS